MAVTRSPRSAAAAVNTCHITVPYPPAGRQDTGLCPHARQLGRSLAASADEDTFSLLFKWLLHSQPTSGLLPGLQCEAVPPHAAGADGGGARATRLAASGRGDHAHKLVVALCSPTLPLADRVTHVASSLFVLVCWAQVRCHFRPCLLRAAVEVAGDHRVAAPKKCSSRTGLATSMKRIMSI